MSVSTMSTIATTKTLFAVYFVGTVVANVEHTIAFRAAATDGTNSLDGFDPFHRLVDPNHTLFGRTLQVNMLCRSEGLFLPQYVRAKQ